MAGSIKGITFEIGGNTQPLEKALKNVNTTARSLQTELTSVNKLLKLDPSNTTLLAQKQQILSSAIANTEDKLNKLKEAQKQAAEMLKNGDIGEDQYRDLERQIIKTEQELGGYRNQLEQVEQQTKETGSETDNLKEKQRQAGEQSDKSGAQMGAAFAAVTAAIQVGIQVVTQIIQKFQEAAVAAAEYADNVNTLAATYQISTDSLQKFQYASDLIDVSVETFGSSIGRLAKNMGQADSGAKKQTEAFKKLGVSIYNSNGQLRDSEDVFYDVIDALGNLNNETQADVYANALFGRSFQDLNPLVVAGTDKLRALGAEAEEVGYVIDSNVLNATNEFQDNLDRMANLSDLATRSFSAGMTPALNRVTEAFNKTLASPSTQRMLEQVGEALGHIVEFFGNLANAIIKNMPTVVAALGAGAAAWVAFQVAGMAMNGTLVPSIIAGCKAIGAAIMNIPIVGWIAAAAAAVTALIVALNGASEEMEDLKADAEDLRDSVSEATLAFDDNIASVEATTAVANDYVETIDAVNKKIKQMKANGEDTTAQEKVLQQTVDSLNATMGETVATIDESTGMLVENTDAIRQNIKQLEEQAKAQAYAEYYADLIKRQVEIEAEKIRLEREGESIQNETIGSQWAYIDAVNATTEAEQENAEQMAIAQEMMQKYGEEAGTTSEQIELLSDNEALRLIRMEANGQEMSAEQAAQLQTYRENCTQQAAALEDLVNQEQELSAKRIEIATDTNEAINYDDQISLEKRIENLRTNQQKILDYENGMASLREEAQKTNNQNMLAYLDTLGDYEIESMGIISQMVADFANGGGEMSKQLADSYVNGLNLSKGGIESATYKAGADAMTKGGEGISDTDAMITEAEGQVKETVDSMESLILDNNSFYFLGIGIMNRVAAGIKQMAYKVYEAVDEVVRTIKNKFTFEVEVSKTSKGGKLRGFATGGVVWNREVVQVAESGPEAIIPLKRLGAVVEGLLNGNRVGGYSNNSSINVTVPIQVSQSLTDADIVAKSKLIARTVSREFALANGR